MQEPLEPNFRWSWPIVNGIVTGKLYREQWAAYDHPESNEPIFVPSCGKCLLARSTPCQTCTQPGFGRSGFCLDPKDFYGDSSFRKYRRAFKKELLSNQAFFRERFLDALRFNLDRSHTDTHLQVHIDIREHETRVSLVDFQRWKDYAPRDPYEKQVRECAELGKNCPDYGGTGIIVFHFNVHYRNGGVLFDVVMGLPLRREEIDGKREPDYQWMTRIGEILWRGHSIDYRQR